MSTSVVLSPKAEKKLQELGKTLTPHSRQVLSTYDEEDQVKWIANPMIQFLIQRTTNQCLERKKTPISGKPKPKPTPAPPPSPNTDSDTSDPEIFPNIFGEDEEEIGNLFEDDKEEEKEKKDDKKKKN